MPGKCHCPDKASFLEADDCSGIKSKHLKWLATQSAYMVNSQGAQCDNIRAVLKKMCFQNGLSRGTLLDYHGISEAISDRFGPEFLNWIRYPAFKGDKPATWIPMTFAKKTLEQRRSPVIPILIIIGTFFSSLAKFEYHLKNDDFQLIKPAELNDSDRQDTFSETAINKVISLANSGKYGLRTISESTGLKDSQVVTILKSQNVRLPLSDHTAKRIGGSNLFKIREALSIGRTKKYIQKRFKVSEWTLMLIELDDPKINKLRRDAIITIRKGKHREIARRTIGKNPNASRVFIQQTKPGTYEYLLKYDAKWFDSSLPKNSQRFSTHPRKEIYNWKKIDEQKAKELQSILIETVKDTKKPVWITETSSLRQINLLGRYHRSKHNFPSVRKVLDTYVEPYDDYVERKISWVLKNHKKSDIISANKLRRKVGVSGATLKRFKRIVNSKAKEYNLKIHDKSSL